MKLGNSRRWRFGGYGLAFAAGIAVLVWVAYSRPPLTDSVDTIPSDPDGFTAYVAKRFKLALPDEMITIAGPLHLAVNGQHADDDAYLDTIFAACRRSASSCDYWVGTFVSQMSASYANTPAPFSRSTLRVVIRPSSWAAQVRQDLAEKGGPAMTPLPGEMWLAAVSDEPTTVKIASRRDLTRLGLSVADGLAIGKQNMESDMRHLIASVLPGDRNNIIGMTGDPYEASLFAFPELWAPLAASLGGNLLVTVPAPDVLLCGNGSAPGMAASLAAESRDVMSNAERPLYPTVFRWTPKGWQVVPVPQNAQD